MRLLSGGLRAIPSIDRYFSVNVQPTGTTQRIGFPARAFVSYDVLFSTDLATWEILTHIPASPQSVMQSIEEPAGTNPRGFFALTPHERGVTHSLRFSMSDLRKTALQAGAGG